MIELGTKMALSQDIPTGSGKGKIYGKEGESVTVTGIYGNVIIVENKVGNKYPVNDSLLIELPGRKK